MDQLDDAYVMEMDVHAWSTREVLLNRIGELTGELEAGLVPVLSTALGASMDWIGDVADAAAQPTAAVSQPADATTTTAEQRDGEAPTFAVGLEDAKALLAQAEAMRLLGACYAASRVQ